MGMLCIWAVWGLPYPLIYVGKLTAMWCVARANVDVRGWSEQKGHFPGPKVGRTPGPPAFVTCVLHGVFSRARNG